MNWLRLETEKRFADPSFSPDWTALDRPAWSPAHSAGNPKFAAWIHRLLDELHEHVIEERARELPNELTPEILQSVSDTLKSGAWQETLRAKLAAIRLAKPRATINDIVKMEEDEELEREKEGWARGDVGRPPRGPDQRKPAAKAARDLWRVRHVILPRFWPEGAKPGRGVTNERLAAIVAVRHGATASATLAWYENERLGAI